MRNKNAKVSDPSSFVTDPGSDIHIIYEGKLLENGQIRLIENGKESISKKINAEKMYTDINYIRSRLEMGDTSVVRSPAQIMYADLSKAPKTLAENLQVFINARTNFDRLDLDTRNKFDNNYLKWLQDAGTKDWAKSMQKYIPDLVIEKETVSTQKETVSEVSADES